METTNATSYKGLLVWQNAVQLAEEVCRATGKLLPNERFGPVPQTWHAAVSVPSQHAKGQARQTTREFLQYLLPAMGSLAKLETQFFLSERLSHRTAGESKEIHRLIADVKRMLKTLRPSLAKRG